MDTPSMMVAGLRIAVPISDYFLCLLPKKEFRNQVDTTGPITLTDEGEP